MSRRNLFALLVLTSILIVPTTQAMTMSDWAAQWGYCVYPVQDSRVIVSQPCSDPAPSDVVVGVTPEQWTTQNALCYSLVTYPPYVIVTQC